MSQRAFVKRRLASTVLATALILAGSVAALAQTASPIAIRIAGSDAINSATPFFVAMRKGFFKEAGLDVTYVTMAGGAAAMSAALKIGELDVGLGSASQYMGDMAKGVISGKLIGEYTDNNYVILGANGISDPKQLKGKIFGISSYNAGDQLYAQAVLGHFGIKSEDVTWLPMGAPGSRLAALMAGKVDGIEMPETSLPDSGKGRIIVTSESSPVPFLSGGVFARQGFLDANKPALQKFLAAFGKGADWARTHPDDAQAACLDSGASADGCNVAIKVATTSKNPYTWSSSLKINTAAIEAMIPIIGVDVPKAKTMKVSDFADTSLTAAK